jgi:hypothetical protein
MASLGYADFLNDHELAVTFVCSGVNYTGVIGDLSEGTGLGAGGFAGEADMTLVAASSQFTTAPSPQATFAVRGKLLRVMNRVLDPTGEFYVFTLVDPTRGV